MDVAFFNLIRKPQIILSKLMTLSSGQGSPKKNNTLKNTNYSHAPLLIILSYIAHN